MRFVHARTGGLLGRWARFVCRHPWLVLAASGLVLLVSAAAAAAGGRLSGQFQPQGQALRVSQLIQRELPQSGRSSFQLVFSSDTLRRTCDSRNRARSKT